ncbi:MAG: hypothetical protein WB626_06925 [Bacteroidota bacterium]
MLEQESPVLGSAALDAVLGIGAEVPTTREEMAARLRVAIFPRGKSTPRLDAFTVKLAAALRRSGAALLDFPDAVDPRTGKLRDGIVVIAPGELGTGDLPVDYAANLRRVTIVGLLDRPLPVEDSHHPQERLNSIVRDLSWSIVQVVIYVQEDAWTICTMNGAIIRCPHGETLDGDVLATLIPKLAAPVVPPHTSDYDLREGDLDVAAPGIAPYARDFASSSPLWQRTGLMLFHTSLDSLKFRNRYYRRIAAAYLDHRSGMSYGFLARQLAGPVRPAETLEEFLRGEADGRAQEGVWRRDDRLWVRLDFHAGPLVAEVPPVWILSTRSGCDKTRIDIARDLVLTGLVRGTVVFKTPRGMSARVDCRPSYDTAAILAHAAGNALAASVLKQLRPGAPFVEAFERSGMAIAHWHGDLDRAALPAGYFVHGRTNPPVSCSTHQSAVFALAGKLGALNESLVRDIPFRGDVHVEPHHGVNVSWESLHGLAEWLLERNERSAPTAREPASPS